MLGGLPECHIGTLWSGPVLSPTQIKKLLKRQALTDLEAESIRESLTPLAELIVEMCLMDAGAQVPLSTPDDSYDRPSHKPPFLAKSRTRG